MRKVRIEGFTLIELMVTIAIMAILATIAYPSFTDTLRSNYVSTATNELLGSLALARSEAIRSNSNGAICSSANGAVCGGIWSDGWIVWVDGNETQDVDAGEAVLRYTQGKAKADVTGPTGPKAAIIFDSHGRATKGAENIGLKPKDAATHLRCIQINPTGQTYVKKKACS